MKINIYLNFDGQTEEAFMFYKSVFDGEFGMLQKMKDAPKGNMLSAEEQNRITHISLPLTDSVVLFGADIIPSMGHVLEHGNNMSISIQVDSKDEADRLFDKLSVDGHVQMPMRFEYWGDYFGRLIDQFGTGWLINFPVPRTNFITDSVLT